MKKFGRGVVNVTTGALEIVREVHVQSQAGIAQGQYPFAAYPEGVVKGVLGGAVKALGRIGSGVYDVVSFPIEVPANYASWYQPATIFAPGNWTPPRSASPPP